MLEGANAGRAHDAEASVIAAARRLWDRLCGRSSIAEAAEPLAARLSATHQAYMQITAGPRDDLVIAHKTQAPAEGEPALRFPKPKKTVPPLLSSNGAARKALVAAYQEHRPIEG